MTVSARGSPDRFSSIEDNRTFCGEFFDWYNTEHRDSGIGYHTTENVQYGNAARVREQRAKVLEDAYAAHPQRFIRAVP